MVAEDKVRLLCLFAAYRSKLYSPLEYRKNVLVHFSVQFEHGGLP